MRMSEHRATAVWERGAGEAFTDLRYSRVHTLRFDGGASVRASSAPTSVRAPMSDPSAVDPEEAFVASIASCHMLWFLYIAARAGFVVDRYEDDAVGTMGRDEFGKTSITEVRLRPRIAFTGASPDSEKMAAMHHEAHDACFIANSVRTQIVVEAQATS
jgi:organic hydroperoxide reductase OsmC/OhrA